VEIPVIEILEYGTVFSLPWAKNGVLFLFSFSKCQLACGVGGVDLPDLRVPYDRRETGASHT